MRLLSVEDLQVRFQVQGGTVHAVNGISFALDKGQTLGIVGESGSGKSQSMLALMGLLAANAQVTGKALFHGQNLLGLPEAGLNRVRGQRMAMVFQDPMTSLNPFLTIERQMTEVLEWHKGMDRRSAKAESVRMLDAVRIPDASRRIGMYPHEFSGGMRQRVMIAMSLLCQPELLIADEPTTALDVTVQAQILALLRELQQNLATAIILITHDLGVVASLCDEVLVMYAGAVVEQGPVRHILQSPTHPYTHGLLRALPRLNRDDDTLQAITGAPPSLAQLPPGCAFHPRCPQAQAVCAVQTPKLQAVPGVSGAHRACLLQAPESSPVPAGAGHG